MSRPFLYAQNCITSKEEILISLSVIPLHIFVISRKGGLFLHTRCFCFLFRKIMIKIMSMNRTVDLFLIDNENILLSWTYY